MNSMCGMLDTKRSVGAIFAEIDAEKIALKKK